MRVLVQTSMMMAVGIACNEEVEPLSRLLLAVLGPTLHQNLELDWNQYHCEVLQRRYQKGE